MDIYVSRIEGSFCMIVFLYFFMKYIVKLLLEGGGGRVRRWFEERGVKWFF